MTKKQSICLGIFYVAITVIVNFIMMFAVLAIDIPVPNTSEYEVWLDFVNTHEIVNTVTTLLSFLVPVVAIRFLIKHLAKNMPKNEGRKIIILNMPLAAASISAIGWLFVFLVQVICTVYIHITTGVAVYSCLKNSAMFTILAFILVFSCTFLILETVNRAKIIPTFLPNEKIAATKNIAKPSLIFTFLMYYIGVAVFPVVVLIFYIVTDAKNNGRNIHWNVVEVVLVTLLVGIFLTIVLANLFRKPLGELAVAAKKISGGDYKTKVNVVSTDELGTLGETFNEMSTSLCEKEFMKDVFGKIVTPDVRDHLLGEGMSGIALGGENMNVTILFCDIRGFTTMSEKLPPEKVVQILNQYFSAMATCITNHHGIINKYIGDAIMAIFGAPVKSQNHAMDAYLAALEMRNALVKVNKEFEAKDFPEIRFGIGIHTGTVLAGNIGSAARMEYTVIGDSVNVASRIEGLCKEYKRDLLISESTVNEMEKTISSQTAMTPNDDGTSPVVGQTGSGVTRDVMPEFLCESPIRGKQEKIKLYSK